MKRGRKIAWSLAAAAMLLPAHLAVGDEPTVPSELPTNEQFVGVWTVDVEPDANSVNNGRNAFKDSILFEADGNFTAEAFGPLGFGRSQYTLSWVDEGTMGFTTTLSNGEQGTLVFNGVLQGSRILGTLVWSKPDGSAGTYNFTASSEAGSGN